MTIERTRIQSFRGRSMLQLAFLLLFHIPQVTRADGSGVPQFLVPDGFVVDKVAGSSLVRYPLFACFDDSGRLYVAEGTGLNVPGEELLQKKLGRITLLEDTDGDDIFDKSTLFADELVFPQGVLWHDGVVYTASHPNIWKLEDIDGDGRADRREVLVGEFGFSGNGCDIHGPFLGPDGYLYWTDGRHGYDISCREGPVLKGLAARIFRSRTDGSRIERIAGGGFDNPVELVFLPDGSLIGTMDQGSGDQILHYVEGGVFPSVEHPSSSELIQTGPPLGSVSSFSAALPVALCGLEQIRTSYFGEHNRGTLLTAQFNVHKVQQHVLMREGSTLRGREQDFLVTLDHDVHPTDVLEDADGSLLVIDMGAWFNYGCPTSKIAKPEILGAIYRVHNKDALTPKDPWGRSIDWDSTSIEKFVALLDDPRLKVRDKAVVRLIQLGPQAVATLAKTYRLATASVDMRTNALWTLARIDHADAREVIRSALADKDPGLRQVALHCVALERDAMAVGMLTQIVVSDEPPLRLKAAEALGRIGEASAIPALLASLRTGGLDRFLEHSIIFALIGIDDRTTTLVALEDPNPNVRRAGLIALDQMPHGGLTRDLVTPLLDTDDPELQQAALDVIGRREGWSAAVVDVVGQWLVDSGLSQQQQRSLTGVLIAFSSEEKFQQIVADATTDPRVPLNNRILLLEVMARSRLTVFPERWQDVLKGMLVDSNSRLQSEVVAVISSRNLSLFDKQLDVLIRDPLRPVDVRIRALECVAGRRVALEDDSFSLLISHLDDDTEPLVRASAARAIGVSRLTDQQLVRLAPEVAVAGPLVIPLLVPAYEKSQSKEVGLALVEVLKRSPGADALTADELNRVLGQYPPEINVAAQPLVEQLIARREQQSEYLMQVKQKLSQVKGDADRGHKLFFSKKVACSGCHLIDGQGGQVGPELSKIGRLRSPTDLTEAVIFPSSTIALGFKSYTITTVEGIVHTGIIVREASDAVYLRTAQLAEIRVPRGVIEELRPSNVSIMPDGLDKSMSSQDLSDLLEFLYSRR